MKITYKLKALYRFFVYDEPIHGPANTNALDSYTKLPPSSQNILDIFRGEWASYLPKSLGLTTSPGFAGLFEDPRIDWAESQLGGFKEKNCLELGPLEGGHSYMLQNKGAKSVKSIEANGRAFLKCLAIKEILGLDKVSFLHGDFMAYFDESEEKYDVIIASGVLYHMLEPLKLLKQISQKTDSLFIWTHYYDEEIIKANQKLKPNFQDLKDIEVDGESYQLAEQFYKEAVAWNGFCGGTSPSSRWLTKDSILNFLKVNGYNKLDISFETPDHPNGPCFAICAKRK